MAGRLGGGTVGEPVNLAEVTQEYRLVHIRMAYRMLRDWEDAEDCAQDAYLKAFEHLGQFRGRSQLSTWVGRIVINCALMRLRDRRILAKRVALVSMEQPLGPDICVKDTIAAPSREPALLVPPDRLLAFIPNQGQRDAVRLRYLEGHTCPEAARITGTPLGTLKARAYFGVRRLRRELAQ